MQRIKTISTISFVFLASLSARIAYGKSDSIFDKEALKCDPALPPTNGGCGYSNFLALINNIIEWLIIIGFPLAAAFIAYGGFAILTAAGSAERIAHGKKIITGTILAMLIAGAAYFIIQGVFTVLGVQDQPGYPFRSNSLDQNLELPK